MPVWMTGEAGSRAHLDLPGNQQQLLEAVAATGKPVVLLVFSGRPLVLNWAAQHVPAIMEAWFPGVQAGPALANVLLGTSAPSGQADRQVSRARSARSRCTTTTSTPGRPADGADLSRPPKDHGEKYLSRYVDEQNSALYPFGYGLTYSTISYSPTTVSASTRQREGSERGHGEAESHGRSEEHGQPRR